MWNRFRDSLVYPRRIVDFRNDRLVWVFLYIILFAILLSTRTIITVISFTELSSADREVLILDMHDIDDSCAIVNANLSCDTAQTQLFYDDVMMRYYIESHNELQLDSYESGYNLVIHEENIHFVFNGRDLYAYPISELPDELQNLDFALQESNPSAFYGQVLDAMESYIMSYKSFWAPFAIMLDFLSSLILFVIFVLLSAWMLKMRFKEVTFKQFFVMTGYSSTGLYIILLFHSLFNLSFLLIILLVVIAFRQNNQLSLELMKRLTKKP